MNVLIFNAHLTHGGVERQIRYLVSELAGRGHNVRVASLHATTDKYPAPIVTIRWPGFFKRSIVKFLVAPLVARKLRKFLRDQAADLVQTWGPYENWVAARAITRTDTVLVSSVRTNRPWAFKFISTWERVSSAVVANASEVITTLEESHRVAKQKLHLVRNAIDLGAYPFREPRPSVAPFTIGLIGRFSSSKNQLLMVDALAELTRRNAALDVKLRLIGAEEATPYRAQVETRIDEHSLADVVTLEPYAADVLEVYRSVDLLVLPSISEGLPNVLLEAMATGTPWVASDVADNEWLAGSDAERGIIFHSESLEGLTGAIESHLNAAHDLVVDRAKRARTFVEQTFSTEKMADEFERIFARVTS